MVVEQSNANPAGASSHIEQTRQDRNPLLITRLLVLWFLLSSQSPLPAREVLGDDGRSEGEGSDDGAGYEERLQAEGTDVGDEGDVGVDLSRIPRAALCEPVDE